MKSFIRGLGLGAALLPTVALAAFSDVRTDHPNADAIMYAQEEGIVQGYNDGTFKPSKQITRAEFTKIIVAAALGYDPAQDPTGADVFALEGLVFTDLKTGAWYVPFVRKSVQALIVSGYPDGTFRPDQTINFAEAAKIVVRAFGIHTADDDVWYRPYVRALGVRSAIPTSVDAFESPLTRGEMAEIVYRLKTKMQDKSSHTYEEMAGADAEPEPGHGAYLEYRDGVIGNGQRSVLYFNAAWCPVCRSQDGELTRWYASQEFPLTTYKVDYDDNVALRTRYGVTYQHTFVLIDEQGNAIRTKQGPNDAELIEFLTAD